MKTFQSIQEERGEKAFKQAMQMGLKYGGFGYWKDANGKTVYKTENDTLVPVEENETSELAGKGGPESAGMAAAGGMGGGMTGPGGTLQMPGMGGPMGQAAGTNPLGAPMPGEEQVAKDNSWEPGPDGDTCVGPGGEQPGTVPVDTYVGRTNFLKWRAGPDGDNMTTITLSRLKEDILDILVEDEQQNLGLTDAGYQEKEATNRAKQRMRRVMGQGTLSPSNRTDRDARSAMNKLRKDPEQQTVFGRQIASMMKIANRQAAPDPMATNIKPPNRSDKERNERNKEHDMWRKAVRLPAIQKDADAVKEMNKVAKGLVKDPNYNMDVDFDDEGYLGEGAFGTVYERPDGNVVKKGNIGPDELKALYAMKDNPRFPTLINAKFDTPFKHMSAEYNNPQGADNERRGPQGYWDPDEASDFDRKFPAAEGTYAMTKAKGRELFNAFDDLSEEAQDKALRSFWKARGDLHKSGFSHNDMHGGNIFIDDDGEVNLIDLGLAKESPISALMEALGGSDYEQGEDYQLSPKMSGSALTGRMREMFDVNREEVEQDLMDNNLKALSDYDDYDEDQDYSPTFQGQSDTISDMMRGGIRMKKEDLENLQEQLPYLKDPENVKKLIKKLYNEVGQSELADRMSDAFSRRQQDTRLIDTANKIRRSKGEKDIEVTNPNVIPPKNMDFDN